MKKGLFILAAAVLAVSCTPKQPGVAVATDPLPSWEPTGSKEAIVNFVTAAVTESNVDFIPEADRIAVFDNDGTLWCEQPLYFEMVYSIDATARIAAGNSVLQKKSEIAALAKGDKAAFMKSGEKGIMEAFAISHTVPAPDQFDKMARGWLDTTRHPRFGRRYAEMTYKPMVELLSFLRANGFKTYIVSGGSAMFIRNFSDQAYGIPSGQVIGTMFKAAYADGKIVLKPEIWLNDDGPGKPEAIFNIIGKKPVLAFGKSDGDLQMLQWTSTNTLPNLCLYLHHTDADREYAYDRASAIGRLDKGLDEAEAKGWVVVDMKNDFNQIFSNE